MTHAHTHTKQVRTVPPPHHSCHCTGWALTQSGILPCAMCVQHHQARCGSPPLSPAAAAAAARQARAGDVSAAFGDACRWVQRVQPSAVWAPAELTRADISCCCCHCRLTAAVAASCNSCSILHKSCYVLPQVPAGICDHDILKCPYLHD